MYRSQCILRNLLSPREYLARSRSNALHFPQHTSTRSRDFIAIRFLRRKNSTRPTPLFYLYASWRFTFGDQSTIEPRNRIRVIDRTGHQARVRRVGSAVGSRVRLFDRLCCEALALSLARSLARMSSRCARKSCEGFRPSGTQRVAPARTEWLDRRHVCGLDSSARLDLMAFTAPTRRLAGRKLC